jgi:N-methylhydantoinase B/oxoprolinase/acetone carboxylase alpha subunit
VLKLRPVEYNLISNDLRQVGFIAQEVQKLVPEVVTGKEGDLNKGEILGITYSNLVPVLAKAIQEQQKQIEDQNAKIAAQQKQIEELIKLVKGR